jgi:hypothetical protein
MSFCCAVCYLTQFCVDVIHTAGQDLAAAIVMWHYVLCGRLRLNEYLSFVELGDM